MLRAFKRYFITKKNRLISSAIIIALVFFFGIFVTAILNYNVGKDSISNDKLYNIHEILREVSATEIPLSPNKLPTDSTSYVIEAKETVANYSNDSLKKIAVEEETFQNSRDHVQSFGQVPDDVEAMESAITNGDIETIFYNYSSCIKNNLQQNVEKFKKHPFPDIEERIRKQCFKIMFGNENGNICNFPSPELVGPLVVDLQPVNSEKLLKELNFVNEGGWWEPFTCIPRSKVAIIIPFRDREEHLLILLRQLHGILRRQQLMYRVFVIEQIDEYPFNRGKLMNVGHNEALKIYPFSCFVFHDVDLIPENDLNNYGCPTSPRHLSCAVDKFGYVLPYHGIFGGVGLFTGDHFAKVNGFPNGYWGWGAEDDNLYRRITEHGFKLTRPSMEEGRYTMIKHRDSNEKPPNRHDKLNKAHEEFQTDGISSLQYEVVDVLNEPLYTRIKVDLNMEGDMIY